MEKGVGDQELRTIIHILLVLYELFLLGFWGLSISKKHFFISLVSSAMIFFNM